MVQSTLQGAAYSLIQANDGADGLAKAKSIQSTTDLNMPIQSVAGYRIALVSKAKVQSKRPFKV